MSTPYVQVLRQDRARLIRLGQAVPSRRFSLSSIVRSSSKDPILGGRTPCMLLPGRRTSITLLIVLIASATPYANISERREQDWRCGRQAQDFATDLRVLGHILCTNCNSVHVAENRVTCTSFCGSGVYAMPNSHATAAPTAIEWFPRVLLVNIHTI